LTEGDKFRNLAVLQIADYVDADDFYDRYSNGAYGKVEAIFHEGACSDTMESDGAYMMRNNFSLSCQLFDACQAQGTRLLYASSAAVYGGSNTFKELPEYEKPLNVYGYSKLLFDQWVRRQTAMFTTQKAQVTGFRYFNVYGPREQHKGRMASVAFHQFNQFQAEGVVKLFSGYDGYAAGEQKRDFVYVDDVAAVNLWFFDHPEKSGVFNLGTGRAQPFNDVALAVVQGLAGQTPSLEQMVENEAIAYIDFPDALKGKYQSYTQADLAALRDTGCDHVFADVAKGISSYLKYLST
jgi:ADP-L-glycero-D-manno-heptose 6-epimerase